MEPRLDRLIVYGWTALVVILAAIGVLKTVGSGSGAATNHSSPLPGVRGDIALIVKRDSTANGAPEPVASCAGERVALDHSPHELRDLTQTQLRQLGFVAAKECGDSYRPLHHLPPASSTAGAMTPAWSAFANQVDTICAVNFNHAQRAVALVESIANKQHWSEDRTEANIYFVWSRGQAATSLDVKNLGTPPARPRLIERWRSNVAHRGNLFKKGGEAWASGNQELAEHTMGRILGLKSLANQLGQRFGLRICTSN